MSMTSRLAIKRDLLCVNRDQQQTIPEADVAAFGNVLEVRYLCVIRRIDYY